MPKWLINFGQCKADFSKSNFSDLFLIQKSLFLRAHVISLGFDISGYKQTISCQCSLAKDHQGKICID